MASEQTERRWGLIAAVVGVSSAIASPFIALATFKAVTEYRVEAIEKSNEKRDDRIDRLLEEVQIVRRAADRLETKVDAVLSKENVR